MLLNKINIIFKCENIYIEMKENFYYLIFLIYWKLYNYIFYDFIIFLNIILFYIYHLYIYFYKKNLNELCHFFISLQI